MRISGKVSKKIGLSKGKVNYRKHERRLIARHQRRNAAIWLRKWKESHER